MCFCWPCPKHCRKAVKATAEARKQTPKAYKNQSKSVARKEILVKILVPPAAPASKRKLRMENSPHIHWGHFANDCDCRRCRPEVIQQNIKGGGWHGSPNNSAWWDHDDDGGQRKRDGKKREVSSKGACHNNRDYASHNVYGNASEADGEDPRPHHVPHSPPLFGMKSPIRRASPARSVQSSSTNGASDGAPGSLHPASMAYPQVYVCPRSMAHLSFPVVDHSANAWDPASPWPRFYMAIAPRCAALDDLRTTLSPEGSGLYLIARSSTNGDAVEINSFKDITELRCNTLQLEIWTSGQPNDMHAGKWQEKMQEKKQEKAKHVPFSFSPSWGRMEPEMKRKARKGKGKVLHQCDY